MLEANLLNEEPLNSELQRETVYLGSSTSYLPLTNKPQINGIELIGNRTSQQLNIPTQEKVNQIESLAKLSNQAISVADYEELVNLLNNAEKTDFNVGQSIMIKKLNVPDVWIYSISDTHTPYTYTNDNNIIEPIKLHNIQMGFYSISQLETQKVDLTNYVKNYDYANENVGGVIKIWTTEESGVVTLNISTEV